MTTVYETYRVTPEEVDFATRIEQNGTVYYLVASRTTVGQDYKVQYSKQHRCLTCTCKAGQNGMTCWHMRAALAAEKIHQAERAQALEATREVQREQAQQAAHVAALNLAAITDSHERQAVRHDEWKAYERRPFSLMK